MKKLLINLFYAMALAVLVPLGAWAQTITSTITGAGVTSGVYTLSFSDPTLGWDVVSVGEGITLETADGGKGVNLVSNEEMNMSITLQSKFKASGIAWAFSGVCNELISVKSTNDHVIGIKMENEDGTLIDIENYYTNNTYEFSYDSNWFPDYDDVFCMLDNQQLTLTITTTEKYSEFNISGIELYNMYVETGFKSTFSKYDEVEQSGDNYIAKATDTSVNWICDQQIHTDAGRNNGIYFYTDVYGDDGWLQETVYSTGDIHLTSDFACDGELKAVYLSFYHDSQNVMPTIKSLEVEDATGAFNTVNYSQSTNGGTSVITLTPTTTTTVAGRVRITLNIPSGGTYDALTDIAIFGPTTSAITQDDNTDTSADQTNGTITSDITGATDDGHFNYTLSFADPDFGWELTEFNGFEEIKTAADGSGITLVKDSYYDYSPYIILKSKFKPSAVIWENSDNDIIKIKSADDISFTLNLKNESNGSLAEGEAKTNEIQPSVTFGYDYIAYTAPEYLTLTLTFDPTDSINISGIELYNMHFAEATQSTFQGDTYSNEGELLERSGDDYIAKDDVYGRDWLCDQPISVWHGAINFSEVISEHEFNFDTGDVHLTSNFECSGELKVAYLMFSDAITIKSLEVQDASGAFVPVDFTSNVRTYFDDVDDLSQVLYELIPTTTTNVDGQVRITLNISDGGYAGTIYKISLIGLEARESYNFAIGQTNITNTNIGNYEGLSYNADSQTLTMNNAKLTEGLTWYGEGDLTISITGENSVAGGIVKNSSYESNLYITKGSTTDDCSLTITRPATGGPAVADFANASELTIVSETSGLLVIDADTALIVTSAVPAPSIAAVEWDYDGDGHPTVALSSTIDGASMSYSLDGKTFTDYTEPFEITEAGAVYARQTKNGAVSPDTVAYYFAFAGDGMSIAYNGKDTTATAPVLLPAVKGFTPELASNNDDIVTVADSIVTAHGIGQTSIVAYLASNEPVSQVNVLNNPDWMPNISVTVRPDVPVLTSDEETADDVVTVTMETGVESTDMLSVNIYYTTEGSDGVASDPIVYEAPVTLWESSTVRAWVVAQDAKEGYYVSDTVTVSYTVRTAAVITADSVQTVTYNGQPQEVEASIDGGELAVAYYLTADDRAEGAEALETAPTDAGTYYVLLTQADENYAPTQAEVTLTILPKTLTDDMVTLSATELPYSGETQRPEVTVSDGDLMTAADYTVTNEGGVAVGEYTVTVSGQHNYTGTVEKTFAIVTRTLGDDDVTFAEGQQYATYYTVTEDLLLPTNIVAYVVTEVGTEAVTVQTVSYVPRNVPVLLEKTTEQAADTDVQEPADEVETNLLKGTAEDTPVSSISGGTVYVLYGNEFVKTTSGTIPAHRAYLVVTAAQQASPAPRLAIGTGGNTTGIGSVAVGSPAGDYYDLNGLRLQGKPAQKGVYIVNGKKVMVNNK